MRRFKNKAINFFRETQEEVREVKKGVITALCYLEFLVIAALIGLCLVMGFQVALSTKLTDQAVELKNEALADRDEAVGEATYYRYLYEDTQEAYEIYMQEHEKK